MAGQQLFKVTLTPPQSWLGAHFSTDLTAVMMQRSILAFAHATPLPEAREQRFARLEATALLSKLTLTLRNSH